MKRDINRRAIIKGGAAAGTGSLIGALVGAAASARITSQRSGPADTALLKVGILGCDGSSHTKGIWSRLINPTNERTRMTGMIMTHVWDYDQNEKNNFAQKNGCAPVEKYSDMIGKVDGIIIGTYSNLRYHHLLVRPYLEAGIPVFINRPFSDSLAHAREIIGMAEKHNAPIMCASSFEFRREVGMLRKKMDEWNWELRGYTADSVMFDYATHGVHGLYLLHKVFGGNVETVSFQCTEWHKPNGAMILKHKNPRTGATYFGSLMQINDGDQAWVKIYGPRFETFEQDFILGPTSWDSDVFFWLPMLLEIQKMFETKKMPEPSESLYQKMQIYLAGWISMLEKGGAPVPLNDIPPDYECPVNREGNWKPVEYPDGYFS